MSCSPHALVDVVCCGAVVPAWYVHVDVAVIVIAVVEVGRKRQKGSSATPDQLPNWVKWWLPRQLGGDHNHETFNMASMYGNSPSHHKRKLSMC